MFSKGKTTSAKFAYQTIWVNSQAQSQVIRLTPVAGGQQRQAVLNNIPGETTSVLFQDLQPGQYVLEADLHTQTNGNGPPIGFIRDLVQAGGQPYTTATDGQTQTLVIQPANATLEVQQTIQLYATARDGANRVLFLPQNAILWEALNDFASVDPQGIVLGEMPGLGIVRATEQSSGKINSATIQVTAANIRRTKWTVMVFLNAANDLDQFSDLNVNQMETVANNPEVRFVLQWKRVQSLGFGAPWSGTRRYLVTHDPDASNQTWTGVKSQLIQDMGPGIDMGSAQTLRQFINWCQTFFPAERYVLVMWNHGSGWRRPDDADRGGYRGVSFDDELGTFIKTWELPDGLNSLERVQVLSWDASLMQMLEVAYEIRNMCDYVVGSEESPPGEGLPYHLVFANLRNNPDRSTEDLTGDFVTGMLQFYGNNRKITQSSIKTNQLNALASAVDQLALALINHQNNYAAAIQQARQNAQSYSPSFNRVYRDLWHLAFLLKQSIPEPDLIAACDQVMAAVQNAVVREGHNVNSPNSHGVSIEFGNAGQTYWDVYALLGLSKNTRWDDFCRNAP